MGSLAVNTGIDYFIGGRPEWGRNMGGYWTGYASSFGKRVVTNSAEFGAASLFKEDLRFRPSHKTGIIPRLKFAATHALMAYGPDNRVEPGYGRFAGIIGVALIEPSWHPNGWCASRFGRNAGFRALDLVQASIMSEFTPDLKQLSQRVRKKILKK